MSVICLPFSLSAQGRPAVPLKFPTSVCVNIRSVCIAAKDAQISSSKDPIGSFSCALSLKTRGVTKGYFLANYRDETMLRQPNECGSQRKKP